MKNFTLILTLFIFLSVSCSKSDNIEFDCIAETLEEFDMLLFSEQEEGCKMFLQLYHHENKQFFMFGNHCMDMVSYPFDCDGNTLCENGQNAACSAFENSAEFIKIVGIEE